MTSRLPLLLASSLLTLTAACGEGAEQARFADFNPVQLEYAYQTAMGGDSAIALQLGTAFSGADAPGACPSIVTDDGVTTVTGGCVDAGGERTDGSLVIENFPGLLFPEYEQIRPSVLTYDELTLLDADGDVIVLDGTVAVSDQNPVLDLDLTFTVAGWTRYTRLALYCDDDGVCAPADGAEFSIDGYGAATIEGTWAKDLPIGALFLHGEDTVIFDISSSDENGCMEYHLDDGSVGEICDQVVLQDE
jgi:hypothetical protein